MHDPDTCEERFVGRTDPSVLSEPASKARRTGSRVREAIEVGAVEVARTGPVVAQNCTARMRRARHTA